MSYGLVMSLALALAQSGGTPSIGQVAAAAGSCELHAWPGDGLHSAYWGFAHAGTADGAVTGRANYPQVSPSALDAGDQATVLGTIDAGQILGRPGYRLVVHDTPLALVGAALNATPYLAAPPACYAELIIQRVTFQQDGFSGSHLATLVSLREFAPDATIRRTFMTTTRTKLERMSRRDRVAVSATDAESEMHQAFGNDLLQFARAYARPPGGRR